MLRVLYDACIPACFQAPGKLSRGYLNRLMAKTVRTSRWECRADVGHVHAQVCAVGTVQEPGARQCLQGLGASPSPEQMLAASSR